MEGKKVILVDDSIIRGNTIELVVEEAKKVGPKEIHIRIGSPPVAFPCYLGIDMQNIDKFLFIQVAEELGYDKFDPEIFNDGEKKNKIIKKIGDRIEVDSIAYLSYEGLKKTLGLNHCYGCWNPDGYDEMFQKDMLRLAKK